MASYSAFVTSLVSRSNSPEINLSSPQSVLWGVTCGRTTPSARLEHFGLSQLGGSKRNRSVDQRRRSNSLDSRSRCRTRTPRALRFSLPASLWLPSEQTAIALGRTPEGETGRAVFELLSLSRGNLQILPQETAAASNRSQLAAKQESKLEILGLSLPPFVRPMESERRVKATSLLAAAFEKGE